MSTRAAGLRRAAVAAALASTVLGLPGTARAAAPGPVGPAAVAPAPVVTTVEYGDDGVIVRGTATPGSEVEVSAGGAQSEPGAALARTTTTAAADGTFTADLPSTGLDGTDLRYASYTASVGEAAGRPHFVDSITASPRASYAYPDARSIKGLQVQLTDDAEELGVQSAAINVSLGAVMRTGPGAGRIAFESGGETYWFDGAAVAGLDRQIKPLSDAGTLVDLILLVYRSGDPSSAAGVLTHPGAAAGAGTVMGFNTVTAAGVRHLTAAAEFLADRYTRPDQRYGRAVGFIVGNEVDAQWEWSNTGERPLASFLDGYARALRIVHLATTKYWAGARSYVSLTHSWTRPAGPNPDPAAPTRYYPGRDVLDGLAALTRATGDFPWHVAHHPYPQDLFDPTVWDDPDATAIPDAPVVTFRNLDQLTTYLERPELRYDGAPRRVILSEQGCNTRGDGGEAERLQAACYAYAYYRTRFLPIDAFILHRHVDHGQEGGLLLGLWARDPASRHPAAPARPKLSHRVFRLIDTDRSLAATDFALDVIGAASWRDLVPGFDADALAQRDLPSATGSRAGVTADGWRELPTAWAPEHNATTVTASDHGVRVDSPGGVFGSQWRSVEQVLPRPLAIGTTPWLVAELRVPAAGSAGALPGDEQVVRLRATTTDGRVVEADARLPVDGRRAAFAADLGELPSGSRLREVQVWVRGSGTAQAATSYVLGRVGLARDPSSSTLPNVIATGGVTTDSDLRSTLTLHVTGLDEERARGTGTLRSCGGWDVPTTTFDLDGLRHGRTVTVEAPVAGGDGRWVCIDVPGGTVRVPAAAEPVVLEDFEEADAVDCWTPGPGVGSVAIVSRIANGPGVPHGGTGALEATGTPAPPNELRSITRTFAEPVDLSVMSSLSLWLDAYGGATGAAGYTATVVVTSGDGSSVRTDLDTFAPDRWNRVDVPLAGWPGRGSVVSITVGFRARGSTLPAWAPRFQVDDLGATP